MKFRIFFDNTHGVRESVVLFSSTADAARTAFLKRMKKLKQSVVVNKVKRVKDAH